MQKFLLLLMVLTMYPMCAMHTLILKKQALKQYARSFFTASQRQKTKDFLKTTIKNPIAFTNVGVTGLCAYGVSKGIMSGNELFTLGSGIQGLLSFANAVKMVKADDRKKIHENNTLWQQPTVKNIQSNPNVELHKTFLVNYLHDLEKQKGSFNICNESFNCLMIANGFVAGSYFISSFFLPQYNLEIMLGSFGNVINAMKLNCDHQESIKIQKQTECYLEETERAEKIIRKKLENEIKK